MVQDLHSHTYYSFCGKDSPSAVIETAIEGGIELLGITDHSGGVALSRKSYHQIPELKYFQRAVNAYADHLTLLQEKYAEKITLKCGIELPSLNQPHLMIPDGSSFSKFDYCLIEHLDSPDSLCENLFDFADRYECKMLGVAHTDLPAFLDDRGIDKFQYFSKMAKRNIFWELNVNYDSIHKYKEHDYVKAFFANTEMQDMVRSSGLRISVGFDGHKIEDYLPDRVHSACRRLTELRIPMIYE